VEDAKRSHQMWLKAKDRMRIRLPPPSVAL